ncbi:hypothetical protein GCK72_006181 [Caenorhabditis remanei]|uniref:Uncharacterized protein n=3 Tax=Caenorhabditis TaxID=6237 RepID=A0A6A5HFM4_CAERE|nr:hypothetical protein GCK72_006181 [Caenorhabditis remanei]KAF1766225.1 hypothetical protein GCK72_006181 [Caenorhabditis remanei]
MTESSPEPLDDLYEERVRRPVVRWQSMKEDGKDANGLRRTETLPEMRPGRRGGRRRLRPRNNNDEDGDSHGSLQHSFLRVPVGLSGRSSPSVASMGSEPESCIDDTRYMTDDDDPIGTLFLYFFCRWEIPKSAWREKH